MFDLDSPRFWHPVFLLRNLYDRWTPRLGCLHIIVVPTAFGIRLPWANHQKEMFRSIRPHKWTMQRHGMVTALYLNSLDVGDGFYGCKTNCRQFLFRLVTLFLYMVAELSALQHIVYTLTGLRGLSAVVVECAITTIYTCKYTSLANHRNEPLTTCTALGGFRISLITNDMEGAMVVGLVILGVICIGVKTHVKKSLDETSGLLRSRLLG